MYPHSRFWRLQCGRIFKCFIRTVDKQTHDPRTNIVQLVGGLLCNLERPTEVLGPQYCTSNGFWDRIPSCLASWILASAEQWFQQLIFKFIRSLYPRGRSTQN